MPELPLPYADTYTEPPVVDRIGNTGAGVALGCRALGLRVTLVDLIGDDPQGALIRDHLTPPGVDFRHAVTAAGTRRSVLLVGPDGRRTSLFIPRAVPGERLPRRDLYLPALRVADTNGAGDAFVSGFLYGRSLGKCVRLGAVAGAHACTVPGTHEDPIRLDALLRA
ncbi:PfkB family carbohydrate kinase [Microbispora sp. NBC_01189]|uniref:PfkB family carbohydrate kinase n=1 Tax=Microbispora sp. NBC_01189 TaxID=2903583 RepID=UPI002E119329|nr:PfkB family carbohydrate kinase [Microbispora sp. NBC_01189]